MANQIGATHVLEEENVQMTQALKAVICFWFKDNHFLADYSSALFVCLTTNKTLKDSKSGKWEVHRLAGCNVIIW